MLHFLEGLYHLLQWLELLQLWRFLVALAVAVINAVYIASLIENPHTADIVIYGIIALGFVVGIIWQVRSGKKEPEEK